MVDLKGIPPERIEDQIAALIAAGCSADVAAEKVIAPYRPAPAADFMASAVQALAGRLEREHHRAVETLALGPGDRLQRRQARLALPRLTFQVAGRSVEWGKATRAEHVARIAWQNGQIAGIEKDIDRHARAVELLDARGATCLDDIDGWVELLAASGGAGGAGPGSARGNGTSGDAPDGPTGDE